MNRNELKEYQKKIEEYKAALKLVYTDGNVSGGERQQLESLKAELGLTTAECQAFESPYTLAKKAEEEEKTLHFADICDCHHMHLCKSGDSGLRWESINHQDIEYIEIGNIYIEKCFGGYGTRNAFIAIGASIEDLFSEYGEVNFPEQAAKDGYVVLFDDDMNSSDIDEYIQARFNILTPLEIEENYTESLGLHGEILSDFVRQANEKEFYDVSLSKEDATSLKEMIISDDDIDLYAFKPPYPIKQDVQLVEWDEKDRPIIQEIDTENGFINLLHELKDYYKNKSDWVEEYKALESLAESFDKGVNEDRYLEHRWNELEDVPFITDEQGREILDAEDGWHQFPKGTTKDEIWQYFDRNYSKGINYLLNEAESQQIGDTVSLSLKQLFDSPDYCPNFDYEKDESIKTEISKELKEGLFIRFTRQDGEMYYDLVDKHTTLYAMDGEEVQILEHESGVYTLLNDDGELPLKFRLSEKDFNIATQSVALEHEKSVSAERRSKREGLVEDWELNKTSNAENKSYIKDGITDDNIFEWFIDTSYKSYEDGNWDFDTNKIKNDVTNLTAINLIKGLANEDLSEYQDATSLSEFIGKKMKENNMLIMPEDNVNYTEDIEPISDFAKELWHNNALQVEVRNYAASISNLEQNKNLHELEKSKKLISDFCFSEYASTPDFSDLQNVGIAYTTYFDDKTQTEYPIQVSVNLVDLYVKGEFNNQEVWRDDNYDSLADLNVECLENLDFEALVSTGGFDVDKVLSKERGELEKILKEEAETVIRDNFDGSTVNRVKLYVPSDYGFEPDNKIHILVETSSNAREDDLFNTLSERNFLLPGGLEVDFNPIKPEKSGTIEEYLLNLEKMNSQQKVKQERMSEHPEKTSKNTDDVVSTFIGRLKESSLVKDYAVDSVLLDAQRVLKTFSAEEKQVIGNWLINSGATSPETLQRKLENEINTKKIQQKREITRHRDEPLHTR